MAFRGMTAPAPVQVGQLFCISQFNFLPLYRHLNTGNQSFVLVVPPLTHTRRCFLINTNHVYQIVAFTYRVRGPMKKESSRRGFRFRFPTIQFGIFLSFFLAVKFKVLPM